MQTLDFVSRLHKCLEFSQPLSCLYQAMQTRKTFSIAKSLHKTPQASFERFLILANDENVVVVVVVSFSGARVR